MAVSLTGAAWTQWERLRQDPWLRMLHGATQRLQRMGLVVAPQAGPRQLAGALRQQRASTNAFHAEQLQALHDWLLQLEAWRYAPSDLDARARRAALGTLQRQYRQMRWPPHAYKKL